MLAVRLGLAQDHNVVGKIEIGDGTVVAYSSTSEASQAFLWDPVDDVVEQDGGEHTSLADARLDNDEVKKIGQEAIVAHYVPDASTIHRVQ